MWTLSNFISLFRALLIFPIGYAVWTNQNLFAFLLGIVAFLSDLADGYAARKMNQVTELGKIIDPLADKFLVGTVVLIMIIRGIIPVWFCIAIIVRDLSILIVGLYASKKLKYVIPSNQTGKFTVGFIALSLVFYAFRWYPAVDYLAIFTLLMMCASIIHYSINLANRLKKSSGKPA